MDRSNILEVGLIPTRDNEVKILERFQRYLKIVWRDHLEWGVDPEDVAMVTCNLLKAELQLDIRDAVADAPYELELDEAEIIKVIRQTIREHDAAEHTVDELVSEAYCKDNPFSLGDK